MNFRHRVQVVYCRQADSPTIFGGSPGDGLDSGASGSFCSGGKKIISRSFFLALPFPFSFSASGFQQSEQISYTMPSMSFCEHSLAWPHRSQRIMVSVPLDCMITPRPYRLCLTGHRICPNRLFTAFKRNSSA